jgi:hypothetical protein
MLPGAKRDSSKRAQIIERCRDATGRRRPRTRIAPEKLAYYGVARPTLSENEFQKKSPVRSASLLERIANAFTHVPTLSESPFLVGRKTERRLPIGALFAQLSWLVPVSIQHGHDPDFPRG